MLVAVGGSSKGVGKTSVAVGLIRALTERRWTAIKITPHEHGTPDAPAPPVYEEREANASDTGRFLAAGAERSFCLRAQPGQIRAVEPFLRSILEANSDVILESNSALEILRPDVFLMLLDLSREEFKPSSLRFMERADAFLIVERETASASAGELAQSLPRNKPQFRIKPPDYVTAAVSDFVRSKLAASASL